MNAVRRAGVHRLVLDAAEGEPQHDASAARHPVAEPLHLEDARVRDEGRVQLRRLLHAALEPQERADLLHGIPLRTPSSMRAHGSRAGVRRAVRGGVALHPCRAPHSPVTSPSGTASRRASATTSPTAACAAGPTSWRSGWPPHPTSRSATPTSPSAAASSGRSSPSRSIRRSHSTPISSASTAAATTSCARACRSRRVATTLMDAADRVVASGSHMLLLSGANPSAHLPLGGLVRRRGEELAVAVRAMLPRDGITFVDNWADEGLEDIRYWSEDRLHLGPARPCAGGEQRADRPRHPGARGVGRRGGRRGSRRARRRAAPPTTTAGTCCRGWAAGSPDARRATTAPRRSPSSPWSTPRAPTRSDGGPPPRRQL